MKNLLGTTLSFPSIFLSAAEEKFTTFTSPSTRRSLRTRFPEFNMSPKIILTILGIIVFVIIIIIFKGSQGTTASKSSKPVAPVSLSKQEINKEFTFPIKDAGGKEISKVKLFVENASIQDDILVKGQRARAVQGRTFLI